MCCRSRSGSKPGDVALPKRARNASRLPPIAPRSGGPGQVADDEAFLSELDVALERPQTRELQPFDAFTPHVREVTYRR